MTAVSNLAYQTPATTDDAPIKAPCQGRVLLVDDMFDNRAVLGRRLTRRGYHVVEAECGEDALAKIAGDRFDLVLLDVMMPGMSGLDVLTEVRRTKSSQELPIIMVTAKSFSEDVVEALQKGADDYVTKPVDFDVALARIVTQVERKRIADAVSERMQERTASLASARDQISREIAERQQSASAARYLATHDQLTGLLNRAQILTVLEQAVDDHAAGGTSYSVLFIDLDRFKAVNDTFGHAIGDKLLKSVARNIVSTLNSRDMAARFGGDEFLILHACEAGSESPLSLAERVIHQLNETFVIDGHELSIGASIGIAMPHSKNEPPEQTIANADVAMYRAKRDGGSRVRAFDLEMAQAAYRRLELERDLRFALKRGQLTLVYQPIVQLSDHTISGFEALLRWNHPQRGPISPSEFIPIAEESGLILQIGEWVLREACKTAMNWPADVKVAVNLSAVQFERGQLVATVVGALAASGLEAGRLELEITESLLLVNSERTIATLRQLREVGVLIAMDDFGTGYSSLSYLRDFEFDKIKVDQSFVRSLATDEGSRAIVDSISGLARTLGITTTAEGVETEDQLKFVRSHGIGQVQGFFFGRPIGEDDVDETIRSVNRE